jgi:spermidine synthase
MDLMKADFEELDYCNTPMGEITLRRRMEPRLRVEVYEVKLGDEFLMSSLFIDGEVALANLALAACEVGPLDVVVGGLGLGYTARAVLDHAAVRSLLVVEALPVVIDWHRRGLVPLGDGLSGDPRCEFIAGDFYARVNSSGMDPRLPDKRFHAILLDIDHSPRHVLHPDHAAFYSPDGLRCLAAHLQPRGVFALWSNDPPDEAFRATLAGVFSSVQAHVVGFHNPLQNREATNTVYLAWEKKQ